MVEQHAHFRKALEQPDEHRDSVLGHLQTDWNVMRLAIGPSRKGSFAVEPGRLAWHGRAGGEETDAGHACIHPALDLIDGVGREDIGGKDADEALGMGFHRLDGVAIVMPINGRSLHDHRFRDARLVHRRDQAVVIHRPLLRPGRLMPAERRQRISRRVRRDHMRMRVENLAQNDSSRLVSSFCDAANLEPPLSIAGIEKSIAGPSIYANIAMHKNR